MGKLSELVIRVVNPSELAQWYKDVMGMDVREDLVNNTWSASYPGPGVTLVFKVIIIVIIVILLWFAWIDKKYSYFRQLPKEVRSMNQAVRVATGRLVSVYRMLISPGTESPDMESPCRLPHSSWTWATSATWATPRASPSSCSSTPSNKTSSNLPLMITLYWVKLPSLDRLLPDLQILRWTGARIHLVCYNFTWNRRSLLKSS